MEQNKKAEFADILGQMMELFGRELTETSARLWWQAFSDLPFEVVANGIAEYIRYGKYPPKPGDVREIIDSTARAQWPTPDEAWAGAQDAIDESKTVVWTKEAQKAFHESAQPVIGGRDNYSPRTTFKDTYKKLVDAAIAEGRRPEWIVGRGWDADHRREAVKKALVDGRISEAQAEPILLETDRTMSSEAQAVAGLITGKVDPAADEPPSDVLIEIFEKLASAPDNSKRNRMKKRQRAIESRREQTRRELKTS